MGQRPQTLYGIADSPIGLAAWFLDHDISSYQMIARAFDGEPEGLTRDDVLDNITITWLTNTAISGARLYWEALPRTSSGFGIEHNNVHFFEPFGVKRSDCRERRSPTSSTRCREAGRNGPIRSSSITTSCPRAGISPPSSSRNFWWRSCGRRSGRCAELAGPGGVAWRRPVLSALRSGETP